MLFWNSDISWGTIIPQGMLQTQPDCKIHDLLEYFQFFSPEYGNVKFREMKHLT